MDRHFGVSVSVAKELRYRNLTDLGYVLCENGAIGNPFGGLPMNSNLQRAREYIQAVESGTAGVALARFFTPDVMIREVPNGVAVHGSISDLTRAPEGAERGKQIVCRQESTITNLLLDGNRVALEIDWLGVTAIPIQSLPAGSEMSDHVAIFLEFREGRIVRQTHYDSFEPW